MRFLLCVIDAVDRPAGLATADEMAAIDAFNDRLQADGHWVFAAGITGPDDATVVDARGASATRSDGSLFAGPAYVAGFWIIEVPDRETAVALATEGSRACNRRVEVRPFIR